MEKEITLIFNNLGLRSFIEVDLCAVCPRQDEKGCCAYYSPVFYPTDLAYLFLNQPELLDHIFSLEHLTILDASVTVNNDIEGESYRCKFHRKEGGCLLAQPLRESVCRHFVCSGIGWIEEESMQDWRVFFENLTDYEISINNNWMNRLKDKGISLRNPAMRPSFFAELINMYTEELNNPPAFMSSMPDRETRTLTRPISFGCDWPL